MVLLVEIPSSMKITNLFRQIFQYFLQGLIILAPIAITVWAVAALFTFVDNILPDMINKIFPNVLGTDANGQPKRIPGLGSVLVIIIVIIVGYISTSFIVGRLVELFGKVLERTPGVKLIYSTLKDFFEAFAGNKRKFDKAALVNIQEDLWQIGFVTQENVQEFGLGGYVAVYIPKSYAFTGNLYFIRQERVRLLTGMTATEAMKFAISGGVTVIEETVVASPAKA